MNYYPGRKSCGSISLDKTIDCLCNAFGKDEIVRAGAIERRCRDKRIDHNVAYACLETLAPHIDEIDIWGGICPDRRRLIRKGLYEWWLDSPETSFDWSSLIDQGILGFAEGLVNGFLTHRKKRLRESVVGLSLLERRKSRGEHNLKLRRAN